MRNSVRCSAVCEQPVLLLLFVLMPLHQPVGWAEQGVAFLLSATTWQLSSLGLVPTNMACRPSQGLLFQHVAVNLCDSRLWCKGLRPPPV